MEVNMHYAGETYYNCENFIQFSVLTLKCNLYVKGNSNFIQFLRKIYINSCPTRCNTKQSIYYSAS